MSKLYSFLAYVTYRVLVFTWRIHVSESKTLRDELAKKQGLFVVAHWHGEELGILHLLKKYRISCIVSTSKDGDIIDGVIKLFGSKTARGSSSKKSVQALLGIIRLTKKGWRPSVAVDGPKGPRHVIKPGVFEIAKTLDIPIFALSMSASRTFIFKKSWNKAELPLPFSKVSIAWSEKFIPNNIAAKSIENVEGLTLALNQAKTTANSFLLKKSPEENN